MLKIKTIIVAAIALLFTVACNGGVKQEKAMENKGKALVVFFSHAGDNYAVGNIEVGNTKIVADYISDHSLTSPRKRRATVSCLPMRAKTPTCRNMTPCSLAVPCGGAPIPR